MKFVEDEPKKGKIGKFSFDGIYEGLDKGEVDLSMYPTFFSNMPNIKANFSSTVTEEYINILTMVHDERKDKINQVLRSILIFDEYTLILLFMVYLLFCFLYETFNRFNNNLLSKNNFIGKNLSPNFKLSHFWELIKPFFGIIQFSSYFAEYKLILIAYIFLFFVIYIHISCMFSTQITLQENEFFIDEFDDLFDKRAGNIQPVFRQTGYIMHIYNYGTDEKSKKFKKLVDKFSIKECAIDFDFENIFTLARTYRNQPIAAIFPSKFNKMGAKGSCSEKLRFIGNLHGLVPHLSKSIFSNYLETVMTSLKNEDEESYINFQINKLFETGHFSLVYDKLHELIIETNLSCYYHESLIFSDASGLKLGNYKDLFIFFGIGLLFSLLLLFIEFLV